MKRNFYKYLFVVFLCYSVTITAQIFGPELLPLGNFGTIETIGKNGDDISRSENIYPLNESNLNLPVYYQPASRVYHNGSIVNTEINPGVTIGYPLPNQTNYDWGFNELWTSDYYTFPTITDENSWQVVPSAPNNGNYLIVTSTNGMYNLPTLNQSNWFEIYDKYETNFNNPTNYFMVTNADNTAEKIFFKGQVEVTPGQMYRMSADLSCLNRGGVNPNVEFVIADTEAELTTAPYNYRTGEIQPNNGAWENKSYNYIATCTESVIFVAFRNYNAGGNGNDVALDNLSLKAIIPQIELVEEDCSNVLQLDGNIPGVFNGLLFQWQIFNGTTYDNIAGETNSTYTLTTEGTYRLSVYSINTQSCPMYSNELEISSDGGGCFGISHPLAVDDEFFGKADILLERNVLDNDSTSGAAISRSSLSVVSFIVNGVSYPAGSIAMINSVFGLPVGVVSIQSNGDFTFRSSPDYIEPVPEIQYVITESGGGLDTANIIINMLEYTIEMADYCAFCPVTINIISPGLEVSNFSYYLYRNEIEVATGTVEADTLTFTYTETQSGNMLYSVYLGNEETIRFNRMIAPNRATWTPNLVIGSHEWKEDDNWSSTTGGGYPFWCTDVVIPSQPAYFPILSGEDEDQCRDITFESGSAVGQIHRLHYRNAYVNYSPNRDEWSMTSAPLKYIYSADYNADPSWGNNAGIEPRIYMRYFDIDYETGNLANPDDSVGYSIGAFSRAFSNLKEELTLAKGYIINIGSGSNNGFNGTFYFPRRNADGSDITYMYHYTDNGEWITDDSAGAQFAPFTLSRGSDEPLDSLTWSNYNLIDFISPRGLDNRYRFIFEVSGSSNIEHAFNFTDDISANTTNIIGNPFMSYVDFNEFYNDNDGVIEPYYRIFDGTNFYSYVVTNGGIEDNPWEGLEDISTGNTQQAPQLIPPMQSFFIQTKNNQTTLVFNADNISTVLEYIVPDSLQTRRTKKSSNVLKIRLQIGEKENTAIVGLLPNASDNYKPNEDVSKLFSDEKSIRQIQNPKFYPVEIFTVVDGQAIEINAMSMEGDDKIIPIGIKTQQTGNTTITVEGIQDFSAYNYIFLVDTESDKTYDLKENATISFEKTTSDNIEGRFYLVMKNQKAATPIYDNTVTDNIINVFTSNKWITVSAPTTEIKDVELYDISGRLIHANHSINAPYIKFKAETNTGIYILRVKSALKTQDFKIKL